MVIKYYSIVIIPMSTNKLNLKKKSKMSNAIINDQTKILLKRVLRIQEKLPVGVNDSISLCYSILWIIKIIKYKLSLKPILFENN